MGNFPQAFHISRLINTAFNLTNASGPAQQRSKGVAPTWQTAGGILAELIDYLPRCKLTIISAMARYFAEEIAEAK